MEEKETLKKHITEWRSERYAAQIRWSAVHHSCLFGSIICSVVAGAVIQVGPELSTFASVLTSIAAVLTGISASGGFERKWRSNRISRSKGDILLFDLDQENPDLEKICETFKEILEKHDLEVVGEANSE